MNKLVKTIENANKVNNTLLSTDNIDTYATTLIELKAIIDIATPKEYDENLIFNGMLLIEEIENKINSLTNDIVENEVIKINDRAKKIALSIDKATKDNFSIETKGTNMLTVANNASKNLSGVIRNIKAFKDEYKLPLQKIGIDSYTVTPKDIKNLWSPSLIIDGKIYENKTIVNPLYNELLSEKYGILYTSIIKNKLNIVTLVYSFTVNKVIKYCK